jgi:hypothetical protein
MNWEAYTDLYSGSAGSSHYGNLERTELFWLVVNISFLSLWENPIAQTVVGL